MSLLDIVQSISVVVRVLVLLALLAFLAYRLS